MRFLPLLVLVALCVAAPIAHAQDPSAHPDSVPVLPPPAPGPHGPAAQPPRFYFGGGIGLSLGSYTRISVQPMFGYKLSPKFSLGGRVQYEYLHHKTNNVTVDTHNYGGGIFGRYRVIPQAYAHIEFQSTNYELQRATGSEREWVPFLLVGGGYVTRMSARTSAYVELLYDVLQDPDSPYDWDPIVSAGIGVGF